jgi:hypothetical protein
MWDLQTLNKLNREREEKLKVEASEPGAEIEQVQKWTPETARLPLPKGTLTIRKIKREAQ